MFVFDILSCLFLAGWERADLLALLCVCDVFLCFVTFPYGVPVGVWYLIVSIPDLCLCSYFKPWPRPHMPLGVGGTLNTHTQIHSRTNNYIYGP